MIGSSDSPKPHPNHSLLHFFLPACRKNRSRHAGELLPSRSSTGMLSADNPSTIAAAHSRREWDEPNATESRNRLMQRWHFVMRRTRETIVLTLLAGATPCSCHHGPAIPSTCGQRETQVVLARSALPVCGPSQDGQVCYVWSDSKFNICRGDRGTWVETGVNGLHAARRRQKVNPDHSFR
jgi:hypothetical protein